MPWTQQNIDDFKAAVAAAKGAKTVRFADQEFTFHTAEDLIELLAAMQNDVAASASESGTSTTRFAATSKGV